MTTHPLPRYVRAPAILLTMLLLACSRRVATPVAAVAPDRAKIDLHLRVMTEADPKARDACEAGVKGALRYHGFVLDSGGVRVEVDVAILRDFTAGTPSFADAPVQGLTGTPPTTPPILESGAERGPQRPGVRHGGPAQGVAHGGQRTPCRVCVRRRALRDGARGGAGRLATRLRAGACRRQRPERCSRRTVTRRAARLDQQALSQLSPEHHPWRIP